MPPTARCERFVFCVSERRAPLRHVESQTKTRALFLSIARLTLPQIGDTGVVIAVQPDEDDAPQPIRVRSFSGQDFWFVFTSAAVAC